MTRQDQLTVVDGDDLADLALLARHADDLDAELVLLGGHERGELVAVADHVVDGLGLVGGQAGEVEPVVTRALDGCPRDVDEVEADVVDRDIGHETSFAGVKTTSSETRIVFLLLLSVTLLH